LAGWIVMLVCIAGVMMAWWLAARRAPPIVFPSEVQELAARDELTPDEEKRFGDALRAHHRQTHVDVAGACGHGRRRTPWMARLEASRPVARRFH